MDNGLIGRHGDNALKPVEAGRRFGFETVIIRFHKTAGNHVKTRRILWRKSRAEIPIALV